MDMLYSRRQSPDRELGGSVTINPKLLRHYIANRGLFARVAKKLRTHPSYVSRVANGTRHSDKVSAAIEAELHKLANLRGDLKLRTRRRPVGASRRSTRVKR